VEESALPSSDANAIDLSGFVVPSAPNPLEESISDTLISNIDVSITALNLASNYTPIGIDHYFIIIIS